MSDLKLATTDYVDEHSSPGYERIKEDATSVYIEGPLFARNLVYVDGRLFVDNAEITPNKYIEENINGWQALSVGRGPKGTINSVFICGPCVSIGDSTYGYIGSTVYINGPTIITISDYNGDVRLDLDSLKLQKLKDLLES